MTWETWSLFAATETALCLTPGPAVLFVVSSALLRGGRRSAPAILGILAANSLYFALSALGLGVALLTSPALFTAIRYAGAAYLVFLGISTAAGRGLASDEPRSSPRPGSDGSRLFGSAFLVQAANPKSLLFFTALLPQFIDPSGNAARQILILGVTSLIVECAVLTAYGFSAGRASGFARDPRFARTSGRVTGLFLVAAAAGLALVGAR